MRPRSRKIDCAGGLSNHMMARVKRRSFRPRTGEFEWIAYFQRQQKLPRDVHVGIGDDCAVVQTGRRGFMGLLKCDACVEGIHFTSKTPLQLVGRKVMARNISDIAAMGGVPRFALVSVALPSNISDPARKKLYLGLRDMSRRHGCEIIGGDTSRSRSGLFVSVFIYGDVEKKLLLTRSGAKKGNDVFVTGKLGGSIKEKHLLFEPRLAQARWLARNFKPTSCIDLSDGLGGDLHRLAEQSHAGFEIDADSIPASPGCSTHQALYDGEDYELLFTIPRSRSGRLQKAWQKKFRLPLTRIGIVRPSSFGIRLREISGRTSKIHPSYDHFRHHA